jgi:hypothetical protein
VVTEAEEQWRVISEIFGSDFSSFDRPASVARRIAMLARSVTGYCAAKVSPRMVIMGNGVVWGLGAIEIVPGISFRRLAKELAQGRPVLFVRVIARKGVFMRLGFDSDARLLSLLNGNACLTISGQRRGQPVFAHIGRGDIGRSTIHRRAHGLSDSRAALAKTDLLQKIAEPIEDFDYGDISVTMQTCLEGRGALPANANAQRLADLLDKTVDAVRQIHAATADFGTRPETAFIARMREGTKDMEDGDAVRLISQTIDETERWIETRKPPSVWVHGDFTLANILFDKDDNLTAIVDWEWARANGCAGLDAMSMAVTAVGLNENRDFSSIVCALIAGEGPPMARDYLRKTLPLLDMNLADVEGLAKLYWLNLIFRSGVWTEPPGKSWWHQMLAPMMAVRAGR